MSCDKKYITQIATGAGHQAKSMFWPILVVYVEQRVTWQATTVIYNYNLTKALKFWDHTRSQKGKKPDTRRIIVIVNQLIEFSITLRSM